MASAATRTFGLFLLSVFIGGALTLFFLFILPEAPGLARVPLVFFIWIRNLVPPHHIGSPAHPTAEATPVNLVAGCFGLIVNSAVYSALVFLLLKSVMKRVSRHASTEQPVA